VTGRGVNRVCRARGGWTGPEAAREPSAGPTAPGPRTPDGPGVPSGPRPHRHPGRAHPADYGSVRALSAAACPR